ncbi:MAG: hypothetical protein EZS28_033541 [Streblomastix strix]|uniref:Uncharacterized protein n=1 Tax=Streblomastix strix TaxID=222440 RepID=A0A5J4UKZ8_9EUKA|nr:MAG: hypothetical protein EZS28_033541 [Streblomastix strix]
MRSTGQEKVIEIEVEKMVREYDGDEDTSSQKINTTTIGVELSEIADNGFISTYDINQLLGMTDSDPPSLDSSPDTPLLASDPLPPLSARSVDFTKLYLSNLIL